MKNARLVTGVDVGNSLVKTVVLSWDKETVSPRILGIGVAESRGLRRGVVVDMEETIHSVGESVRRAETMAGVKIKRAYVAVNGMHINTQLSRGVIAVSRADNEITPNDVERVVDAASIVSLPPNREIIHIIPKNYLVDGQEYVKNPLGMKGVRLEAEVLIIDGLSPYLRNLAKCLNANGVEVAEFVFAPQAISQAVLDKNQREHGVISLDLGGGVSTLSFFREGEMIFASTIPVGSRHITNDLAIALRTSMEAAEEVKLNYGFVHFVPAAKSGNKGMVGGAKKDDLDLSRLVGEDNFIVPRKHISQVVEARVNEILDLVQNELKKISRIDLIPAGIVLSGGGAKLPGLGNLVKEKFKLPTRIGLRRSLRSAYAAEENASQSSPVDLEESNSSRDFASDSSLATATGLALYGLEKELPGINNLSFSDFNGKITKESSKIFHQFISKLKEFIP